VGKITFKSIVMQKQNPNQNRLLKVYPKHQARRSNKFKVVPEIRLCGEWLSATGFKSGQTVIVQQMSNQIISVCNA
jgi:toxic protein SymE